MPALSRRQSAGEEICVLAPWLIFTVTIERGSRGDDEIYLHAGGQGFWVARMIKRLGCRPVLCAPAGGETGAVVEALVRAEEIEFRAIESQGWNGGYVHDRRGGQRDQIALRKSRKLNRHELDDLYDAALTTGLRAGVIVLTGLIDEEILPADFFRRMALDLHANNVKVVADLAGAPLAALQGGLSFLKVSHEELIDGGHSHTDDRAAIIAGIRSLHDSAGACNVVVSRAEQPGLALLGDRLVEFAAPRFEPLDHRGAGDSMTAALAVAQARGLTDEDALRLGAAAGALNVTRHGLGTGDFRDIQEIAKLVTVQEIKD